ncbi:MAG: hypothetical protein ACTSXZ_03700, partial [Alphaproteobacteria bacterium]
AAVMLVVLLAAPQISTWTRNAEPVHVWPQLEQIRQATPPGARIGYTDCGIFGYYLTDRTIINLDGILNFDAQRAIRDESIGIDVYMEKENVQYVLYLHNFHAEFKEQWDKNIAPIVEPLPEAGWIFQR